MPPPMTKVSAILIKLAITANLSETFAPPSTTTYGRCGASLSCTRTSTSLLTSSPAALGKRAVVCADRAGFVVNALLFPYLNDAVRMVEASYSTADDIDSAMKLGCGYPMGPFELLDVVGLDVSLAIERELYIEFREPGFAPAPLLEHLVTAGYLGRKTGRGFRDYASR